MTANEIIKFSKDIQDKSDDEIEAFVKRLKKKYPKMPKEEKALLDKHWDLMESLLMYF